MKYFDKNIVLNFMKYNNTSNEVETIRRRYNFDFKSKFDLSKVMALSIDLLNASKSELITKIENNEIELNKNLYEDNFDIDVRIHLKYNDDTQSDIAITSFDEALYISYILIQNGIKVILI